MKAMMDQREIRKEYRKRAWRQLLVNALMLPSFIYVLVWIERAVGTLTRFFLPGNSSAAVFGTTSHVPDLLLGPMALVITFIGCRYSCRNWCCPACGTYLRRQVFPRQCSSCEVAFSD
jgi:hypothetical protein